MTLDITTPRGRIAANDQHAALDILRSAWPSVQIVETSDMDRAHVDAIAVKDGIASAVFEVKSRDMTEAQLKKFGDEWLVTFEKVLTGINVAYSLAVPFFGLLYLVPDKKLMLVKIADKDGKSCCKFRVETTETQATCNGGLALRANAFIDMNGATVYG